MQKRRALSRPHRNPSQRLALEPRIVFDGAMPIAAADAAGHDASVHTAAPEAKHVDTPAAPAHAQPSAPASAPAAATAAVERGPSRAPNGLLRSADEAAGTPSPGDADAHGPAAAAPVQIAFVDASVKDIEAYLPAFHGEVVTLRADQDGVAQIAQALAGRTGVGAIHIVSHGEAGELSLGSGTLDAAGIGGAHAAEMAAIRAALTQQGDILLYGCDVAAGAVGQAFIGQLAQATGADVAASIDATGAADRGGNWTLEAHTGAIEARSLDAGAWEGLLSQTSSGTFTTAGAANLITASNTAGGVTTTVSFGSFSTLTSGVSNLTTSGVGGTLNNIAVFTPAVQNTASLGIQFNWDTLAEGATTEASTDAGTGVITITFSQAVTNPILHLDRLGGSDGTVQNGMRFTLVNPGGLSLTRLSGTSHFAVDSAAGTIQNAQIDQAIGGGYTSESSMTANLGSAAGSVQVNGTVTSVSFVMSAAPNSNEGGGSDAFEMKVTYDATPIASNDAFGTPHDTPITLNVRANDSDLNNDALTVTKVNGTGLTAGGAGVSVTGGSVALSAGGNLVFAPTAGYTGAASFTYTIADANGGESTATVSGNVTDVAPVVDLNSGSTPVQRVGNGTFNGSFNGWTKTGTAGTYNTNVFYWDNDRTTGTLTQTGLTGLDNGYGSNGAAQVSFDLGWNNGGPDTTTPATLDLSIGGVVYARLTTNSDGVNGTVGYLTYLNGASGPVTSIASSTYRAWTYTNIVVNLPSNVAASGSLVFNYDAGGATGSDDISIDNVSVLTRTDNTAGVNFATTYIENAVPSSIASAASEVRDNDNTVLASATIVLTNRQTDDLLSVTGSLPVGITASAYDASTGTLTLTGSATLADYNTAIRAVGFSNTGDNPSTAARTVTVKVNDGIVDSALATTTITVVAVNDAPVANNDSFTGKEDIAFTFNPRSNDTDAENNALTITKINGTAITADSLGIAVTGGVVVMNLNGSLTFVPNVDYNGNSSFSYTISDGNGGTSTANVTLTIAAVNDAPLVDLNGPTAATTAPVADGARDASAPTNAWEVLLYGGTFAVAGSTAPNNADRTQGGAAGTPLLLGEIYLGQDDTPLVIRDDQILAGEKAQNVLIRTGNSYGGTYVANATNGDFNPASGSVFQYVARRTMTAAGTIELGQAGSAIDDFAEIFVNGTRVAQQLSFTYNLGGPIRANFNAGDVVEIRLGNQGGTGAFSVDARITNINYATGYTENAAPVSIAAANSTVGDSDNTTLASATVVLTNRQAGDLLSVTAGLPAGITASAYNASTGTLTLSGSATLADYNAAIRAIGFSNSTDNPSTVARSVTVKVNDGTVDSALATTTISVTAVNDAPSAVNDSFTIAEDSGPVTIDVRANDTDPEGDAFNVTAVNGTAITSGGAGVAVTGGTVTLDGSGRLVFAPNANYNGSPSFTYTVTDVNGAASTATVNGTVTPVEDAPTSSAPAAVSLAEDATFAFVGGNTLSVADVDGTPLSVTLSVANGTLTLGTLTGLTFSAGDGTADATMSFSGTQAQLNAALATLTFRPTADYNGAATLNFGTTDGTATTSKSVALTITPVADIVADAVSTNEDTAIAFNAITGTNGSSADNFENAGRAVTAVTQGAHGSVSFAADGTLTYTPAANYNGADTFTYTVTSGGVTETATVSVTVVAVNDAPTSTAPAAVTSAEDTTIAFTGGNALSVGDIDSASLTVTLSATNGTLTLGTVIGLGFAAGDGTSDATMTFTGTQAQLNAALASLTYAPTADYNGTASIVFSTSDGSLGTSKTVALTITPVADLVNDTVATSEDTAVGFNVLTGTNGASADNFENAGRTVTAVTQGAHGSVTFAANGALTYTPAANYNGTDTFTYTVSSGGVTETGSVTVNIAPVDDAPTSAAPAAITSAEDTTIAFTGGNTLSVSDIDNASLTVTLSVTNGTLTLGTTTGLSFSGGDGTSDATMTFSGTQAQLNAALASLTFAPTADYHGSAALSFNTSDGMLGASKTVALTITPVVDIVGDAITTAEDTTVSFNVLTGTNGASADNFENAGRTVTAVTQGAHGSVSFAADGTLTYVPAANYNGSDSFSYTVTSGGVTETATVTMTVTPVNDAPASVNDSFVVAEDNTATIDVRSNDSDVDGDALTVTRVNGTAISAGGAGVAVTGGIVTLDANGRLVYTPNANYNGSPSFTYTVADPSGATATATVNGTVTPVNDPPVASDDSASATEDGSTSGNVLTNDSDVDADPLHVSAVAGIAGNIGASVTGNQGGLFTVNADGSYSFTSNGQFEDLGAGQSRTTSISYTLSDGHGGSASATLSVTVTGINDAPIAVADSYDTVDTAGSPGGLALSGSVLANDSDAEHATLGVSAVNGSPANVASPCAGSYGTLTMSANGSFSYAVDRNNPAVAALLRGQPALTENFTYTASDGAGGFATTTLVIRINGTNDSPDAGNDTNAIAQGQASASGNVISGVRTSGDGTTTTAAGAQDSDPNGDPITVNEIRLPAEASGASVSAGTPGSRTGSYGTLTIAADGSYSYLLDNASPRVQALLPGQHATETFVYTVTDGASSVDATITIVVSGTNDAPVARNDSFTTAEDTPITIDARGNDSDPDDDAVTVTHVNGSAIVIGGAGVAVSGGTVTLDASGNLVFSPSANYHGSPSFTYTIADPSGATSTATVTGTVTPVNDAPVAADDSFTTPEDTPVTIAVRGNDIDVDGDTLTVTRVAGQPITAGGAGVAVTGGTVTLNGSGQLVFTPNANYNGGIGFTYEVSDPSGVTSTATVNGTVTPVNDAPVAANDSFTTAEDTAATIAVRTNDTDIDGDALTVTQVNGQVITAGGAAVAVTGGSVTLDASGRLVFTPTANYNGSPSFTYTVADPSGATSTATVNGTVTPVNDAPVATDDSFTVAEDTSATINVRANDIDVDGDTLTVTQVNGTAITAGGAAVAVTGGSVTLNGAGNLVFTPTANYNGSPSFTYTVADPSGVTSTATVNGTVMPVNDAPVANNDSFTIAEDTSATIDVCANDTDIDGDALTVTQVNGQAITAGGAAVAVTGGSVTLNGAGNLVFTPTANYNGSPSFTYTVADPSGATSTATVNGTVTLVNDAPVANNDSFTIAEDTSATINVRANDGDVDGDAITVTQVNGTAIVAGGAGVAVTGGSVTLNGAGNLVFTPTANYNGSPSFTYTVADPSGATSTATVDGTVTPVNDAPVANNDSFTVNEDTTATIAVRANDTDVDGDTLTVTQVNGQAITAGGAPVAVTGGSVALNGSGQLVFTPTANYNGSPSFTYTVADPSGATSTASVNGTVTPVNDPPVANPDSFTVAEDGSTTIDLLANDVDPDGDPIALILVDGHAISAGGAPVAVAGGTVALNGANQLVFTPSANFNGPVSFSYTIGDASGSSSSASVSGTVMPVNDAPVATNDSFTVAEDNAATIDVRANDSDVDGDALTVTQVNGTAISAGGAAVAVTGGSVTLDGSGRLLFTPAANYNGATSFSYTVADPSGATATATVNGSVTPVNDAPASVNESFMVAEDNTATIDVRSNDSDVDGDALTVTRVNGTAISAGGAGVAVTGGIVTLDANGRLVYTPNANYNGSPSFTYTVADPSGATATATVNGTVTPVNDPPVASDDSASATEDGSTSGNVLTNDSDVDADPLHVSAVAGIAGNIGASVTGNQGGLFTVNADGSYSFTSNGQFEDLGAGQSRTTSISYTLSDGHGGSASATLSVTVTGINDAPIAVADSYDTVDTAGSPGGLALSGSVLANDSDAEHATLGVSAVNGSPANVASPCAGSYGTLTMSANGSFSYAVDRNNPAVAALLRGQPALTENFTYTASDGAGGFATTTLVIRINGTNDSPDAGNDTNAIAQGQASASGNVISGVRTSGDGTTTTAAGAQDSDPNGDPITVNEIRLPAEASGASVSAGTPGSRTGSYGTLTIAADGSYSYLLDNASPRVQALLPGQHATETFVYTVTDGASSVDATITIVVSGTNDAPVAVNDAGSTLADHATSGDVLLNDTDPDVGQTLAVNAVGGAAGAVGTPVAGSTGGLFTLNADGSYSFDPNGDFAALGAGQTRNSSIAYTVSDGNGGFATATLSVTVTGLNDAPVAANDTFTTPEDTPVTIAVRGNDTDVDGDTLTITRVAGQPVTAGGPAVAVGGGTVALDASGNLVLTPSANYSGGVAFTYEVRDPSGVTSTATVNGTVTPVNDAPVAGSDSFTIAEDTSATIDVRANDSDVDGDALTVTQVNGTAISAGGAAVAVTGGSVTLDASGRLVFTPTANYNGSPSFTYTVADPSGATSTATVNGTVTSVNDAPVANNDSFTVAEDTSATINVRANDSDIDGDALTVTQVNGQAITAGGAAVAVTGGSVTLNGAGNLVFTPTANYNGSPSFTYTVADPSGVTSTATVNGTVTPVNDAPVANNDSFTIAEDASATIDVRANDSDIDGDTLTVTQVNGQPITAGGAAVAVTGGSVTLNGAGNLVFTPTANYNGSPSFTYTVADPSGATSTATVNGTVTPVNDAPVAVADTATTRVDTPVTVDVLANDRDVDGALDPASVQLAGTANPGDALVVAGQGTWRIAPATGAITFTPVSGFTGMANTVAYSVADTSGLRGAPVALSVNVLAVNRAPVASADAFTTAEDTAVTIAVRANDSDADGDALTVTQVNGQAITAGGSGVAVTGGSVTLNAAGNLVFTPTANYHGSPSFTYTVADPSGATATGSVNGTVTAVNDAPVAGADTFTIAEDTRATIDVRANDRDVDGDALTVTQVNGTAITAGGAAVAVTGGSVALDTSGRLVFTPTANYNGSPSFTYTVADPSGATSTGSVSGTVTPVNDAPVANNDSFTVAEDTSATIDVRANDGDVDGDALTVTQVNGAAISAGGAAVAVTGGSVTLDASGRLVFTPTANYNGATSFSYTVADPSGATSTATLSGTVTPVDDAPVAAPVTVDTSGGRPVTIDVLSGAHDVDGDALTVTHVDGHAIAVGGPGVAVAGGIVTLNADGTLRYTPTAGAGVAGAGAAAASGRFSFTVADPDGATATGTVTLRGDEPMPAAPSPTTAPAPAPRHDAIVGTPALHVLASVSDARSALALSNATPGLPIDAVTAAEIARGLGDDLDFASGSVVDGITLLGRDTDIVRNQAFGAHDTLFVQHAVRHESFADGQALYVQKAVRQSQSDAQLRDLQAGMPNSAALGASTLFDPFALGAPGSARAPAADGSVRAAAAAASAGQREVRASVDRASADPVAGPRSPNEPDDELPLDALLAPPRERGTAPAFTAQLRQSANTFRARTSPQAASTAPPLTVTRAGSPATLNPQPVAGPAAR